MDARSTPGSQLTHGYTDKLCSLFNAKKIQFELFDGALEENKAERNKLFSISEKRAVYPQVFIRPSDGSGDPTFVGDWDGITELNEMNEHNGAFDKVFGHLVNTRTASPSPAPEAAPEPAAAPEVVEVKPSTAPAATSSDATEAAAPPLPEGWFECKSSTGRTYFANKTTKETSWVRPSGKDAGPWRTMTSSKGKEYYYNTVTGETSWTPPEDL